MSLPFRVSLSLLLLLLAACDREKRDWRGKTLPETGPGGAFLVHADRPDPRAADYRDNAYQVSQGQTYFRWMNCNGCHANGGGGMGPALTDSKWRYGGSMEEIVATIHQGRPNGMPSFAGKLTPQQMWQIAAFVRTLSANDAQAVRSGRAEALSSGEPPTLRDPRPPRRVSADQDQETVE